MKTEVLYSVVYTTPSGAVVRLGRKSEEEALADWKRRTEQLGHGARCRITVERQTEIRIRETIAG